MPLRSPTSFSFALAGACPGRSWVEQPPGSQQEGFFRLQRSEFSSQRSAARYGASPTLKNRQRIEH
jgi:hypothetical protein